MKAEEARNKAIENAKWQTDLVISLIEQAVQQGQLSVLLDIPIPEATEKYLKDNGYTVTILDGTTEYKKWRIKISWK